MPLSGIAGKDFIGVRDLSNPDYTVGYIFKSEKTALFIRVKWIFWQIFLEQINVRKTKKTFDLKKVSHYSERNKNKLV